MNPVLAQFISFQPNHQIMTYFSKGTHDGHYQKTLAVLCYPMPQELTRAYWFYKQVSHKLNRMGIDTVRFDYPGTGDSSGNIKNFSYKNWLDSAVFIAEHFKKKQGSEKILVLGTRIGATIAAEIARTVPANYQILVDPIKSGLELNLEMNELQRMFTENNPYAAPFVPKNCQSQVFGFPWNPEFLTSMADFHEIVKIANTHIILSTPKNNELINKSSSPETHSVSDDFSWNEPQKLGLRCFPNQSVNLIESILKGHVRDV